MTANSLKLAKFSSLLIRNQSKGFASVSSQPQTTALVGPAVKLLFFHYNLEPNSVPERSGPKKNVLKSDVLRHVNSKKLTPVRRQTATKAPIADIPSDKKPQTAKAAAKQAEGPPQVPQRKQGRHVDIPLTSMRQTIAKRLSQSKSTIPHAYLSASFPTIKLLQVRDKLAKHSGLKLSINDFVIKACAQTLRTHPALNVQWRDDAVQAMPSVDISVAVATPNGLITPILFGADRLGLEGIGQKMRELGGKARDGKLRPEEFQGGTFTISNLGMFRSVSTFTAIINPPQAAILAVGGLVHAAGTSVGLTLCYDARAIQDGDAQRFMQALRLALAEPEALLAGFGGGMGDEYLDLDLLEEEDMGLDQSVPNSESAIADELEAKMLSKLL